MPCGFKVSDEVPPGKCFKYDRGRMRGTDNTRMTKLSASFLALLALLPFAAAQSAVYGQCGGINWTGPTTCVSGSTCVNYNPYYSQCIPVPVTSTTASSTTTSVTSTTTTSTTPLPTGTSTVGLSTAAKAAGKTYFGSATDNGELTDAPYVALLSDTTQFTQLTPDATEASQGVFTFTRGDAIVTLAQANGQLVRGHTCVWHSQLPSWVTAGNFDAATLASIVQNHTSTVVGHYKGKIYSWDVVNGKDWYMTEPFNEDGTFRTSVFYNTLGSSYIATALTAARAADPAAKLYINDYNIDGTGAKSTAMVNLVTSLKAAGVPVDGIGIQGHLIVGSVPSTIQANIAQFTALGVEVAITELDIRMTLPVTAEKLAQQQKDYQTVISACKAVPGCVGITIWDYTDKYSWVPSVFSGQGAALPWDENLVKKPAYDGIIAGLA